MRCIEILLIWYGSTDEDESSDCVEEIVEGNIIGTDHDDIIEFQA